MKSVKSLVLFLGLLFSAAIFAAPANINTADAQALAVAIDGVGLKKAQAIVAYRKANGPFKSINDLINVKGIGEKTVANNQERISVK